MNNQNAVWHGRQQCTKTSEVRSHWSWGTQGVCGMMTFCGDFFFFQIWSSGLAVGKFIIDDTLIFNSNCNLNGWSAIFTLKCLWWKCYMMHFLNYSTKYSVNYSAEYYPTEIRRDILSKFSFITVDRNRSVLILMCAD